MATIPPNGKYFIVSKETTSDGKLLAITYNGEHTPLTVTELGTQANQVWILADGAHKDLQAVYPVETGTTVEVDRASRYTLQPVKAHGACWTIRGWEGEYTFRDGGVKFFWSLTEAKIGGELYTGPEKPPYFWRLILC